MAKQLELDLDVKETKQDGLVTCLGIKFSNDEARRIHFIELLREKLKNPEFRKIEGIPIGEDEDIPALSDPPYYTACCNPFPWWLKASLSPAFGCPSLPKPCPGHGGFLKFACNPTGFHQIQN